MSARLEKRAPPGSPPHERQSTAGFWGGAPSAPPTAGARDASRARAERGAASFMARILSRARRFEEKEVGSAPRWIQRRPRIQRFPYMRFRGSPLDCQGGGHKVPALLARRSIFGFSRTKTLEGIVTS